MSRDANPGRLSLALERFRAWDLAPSARQRLPGLLARFRATLGASHAALLWEDEAGGGVDGIAWSPLGDWWRAFAPGLEQGEPFWWWPLEVPLREGSVRRAYLIALGATEGDVAGVRRSLVAVHLRNVQAELSCSLLEDELDRRPEELADLERTSRALGQSERRLRTIVEHAPVGIGLLTENLTWQRLNDQLCKLLGCLPEDVLGADFEGVLTAEGWALVEPRLREVQRGELECLRIEQRVVSLGGGSTWCVITVSLALPGATDGKLVVIVDDISERYEFRQRLLQQTRHKDEFLAMLGHELRNPLSAIANATKLLQARDLESDPALLRVSGVLERQCAQMRRMVDDLLDVSRIEAGKVRLRLAEVDLCALARDVSEDMAERFSRKALTLTFVPCAGPLWVRGDRVRLAQVLQNILDNAVKFTDDGGSVTLTLAAEGEEATVRVRDTGIGMDASLLDLAFDTFRQADRSLERARGGLGLGLSLVKGLVELHDGTVEATSGGLGRGTEVCVRLARCPAPNEAGVQPSALPERARLHILLVEDNQDSADTLKELLESRCFEVSVAYDAAGARSRARADAPELVLCDIGLPNVSGFELASALRMEHGPSLRLVALTGYGGDAERESARRAGFDAHLTKPLDLDAFDELVRAFSSAVEGEAQEAADVHPRKS